MYLRDKQEPNNQNPVIEDLPIHDEQSAEVTGGRSTELSGAVWSGVYDRAS